MKNKIASIFIIFTIIVMLNGCDLNFFNKTTTPESMVGVYKFETLLVDGEDQTTTMLNNPNATLYYYFGQDGTHFTVLAVSDAPFESMNTTPYSYSAGSLTIATSTYTVYEKNNGLYLKTMFGNAGSQQEMIMMFSYVDETTSQQIIDYFIS